MAPDTILPEQRLYVFGEIDSVGLLRRQEVSEQ
jgi:hypothetical protein